VTRLPDNFADLVEHWTLLPAETNLLTGKHEGATKLGFALLFKFYGRYGRFPRGRSELKSEAVEFVASQVKARAADLGVYEWDGPTIDEASAEIRRFFGFREFTVADGGKLADWLARDYAQRCASGSWCASSSCRSAVPGRWSRRAPKQTDRIVGGACVGPGGRRRSRRGWPIGSTRRPWSRLLALLETGDEDPGDGGGLDEDPGLPRWLKASAGDANLKTMLDEMAKLEAIRSFALPAGLLRDVAVKVVDEWVTQALIESPGHMRRHSVPLRTAMLAALL